MARNPYYAQGAYAAEVVETALTKASTGTIQFAVRFRVLGFETGDAVPAQYERTMFLAITPASLPYFIEKLRALGYSGESFAGLDQNSPHSHNFIGAHFTAFCRHENRLNGELAEKWDVSYQGASGRIEVKPVAAAEVRQLDAQFGRALRAGMAGQASTSADGLPAGMETGAGMEMDARMEMGAGSETGTAARMESNIAARSKAAAGSGFAGPDVLIGARTTSSPYRDNIGDSDVPF